MKSIKMAFAVVLLASGMSHVMADAPDTFVSGGTISFAGAITEESCSVSQQVEGIASTCYRDGVTKTTTITRPEQPLRDNIAQTHTSWLNDQHTLGIVTISYN